MCELGLNQPRPVVSRCSFTSDTLPHSISFSPSPHISSLLPISLSFFLLHAFIPIIIILCSPLSVTIEMPQCPFWHKAQGVEKIPCTLSSISLCPAPSYTFLLSLPHSCVHLHFFSVNELISFHRGAQQIRRYCIMAKTGKAPFLSLTSN